MGLTKKIEKYFEKRDNLLNELGIRELVTDFTPIITVTRLETNKFQDAIDAEDAKGNIYYISDVKAIMTKEELTIVIGSDVTIERDIILIKYN